MAKSSLPNNKVNNKNKLKERLKQKQINSTPTSCKRNPDFELPEFYSDLSPSYLIDTPHIHENKNRSYEGK